MKLFDRIEESVSKKDELARAISVSVIHYLSLYPYNKTKKTTTIPIHGNAEIGGCLFREILEQLGRRI